MALTKNQRDQLARLETVTELVYLRDAAAYRAHHAKIVELETSISKLRESLRTEPDPAALDSADMLLLNKHRTWVKQMLRSLNIELAKAYSDADAQRSALVQSNGRRVAVSRLRSED